MTAVGENIVMDNLEVFRKNGFQFEIDHEGMLTYQLVGKWILFVKIHHQQARVHKN